MLSTEQCNINLIDVVHRKEIAPQSAYKEHHKIHAKSKMFK